jgi:Cys-tRNA(Pro)/Cys-tRNA(Cys) deacylase
MEIDRGEGTSPATGDAEARIIALLTAHGVRFRVHAHTVAVTVADAAARLPFPQDQFLKTVAFTAGGTGWILAALRAHDRVDYRKLAAAAGVRRADLRQPDPAEVAVALGMAAGGIGPFPLATATLVIVDNAATGMDTVYCGMGRSDRTLEIGLRDLIRVVHAHVHPIAQDRAS